jgi:glutamate/aspartate transport system permease protein
MGYTFDFDVIARSLPYLWTGLQYTLKLTFVSMCGGIFLGTFLALARLSSIPLLKFGAASYVNLMRSIPLILVIFWLYFLVPFLIGQPVGPDSSAYITFTLFQAAYYCEIIRAGIQSIPRGQAGAAQALGLTYQQSTFYIILPQAFRNMIPILLTQTIVLFQDTSLVYVLSVTDLLGAASKVAQRDFRLVEMYSFVAFIYFIISYLLSLTVKRLQNKIAIKR